MTEPLAMPTPPERWAAHLGRTPAEVAAWDRFLAAARELVVARGRLDVAAHECTGALSNFAAALEANDRQLAAQEAQAIAEHPDLAEFNVFLDGYYQEAP